MAYVRSARPGIPATHEKIFLTPDKLGFSPEDEQASREIIVKPHGIKLVTGRRACCSMNRAAPEDDVSSDPENLRLATQPGARPLIYIVDDEITIGEAIAMHLERAGFRTRVFRSPVLAFATFALTPIRPSVLITGYGMGEMHGLELMRKCKQLHPVLKLIGMSGTADLAILREAAIKPDVVLGKPFAFERLIAEVRVLTGG